MYLELIRMGKKWRNKNVGDVLSVKNQLPFGKPNSEWF